MYSQFMMHGQKNIKLSTVFYCQFDISLYYFAVNWMAVECVWHRNVDPNVVEEPCTCLSIGVYSNQ